MEAGPLQRIHRALADLALPRDGALIVHASFSALSRAGHTPRDFAGALASYMSLGTLLMPAMSWRSVTPQNPIFDEIATPGITGVLSETFRTQLADVRSLHPTHSVCGLGRHARTMLEEHHLDTKPCSARSPFGKLVAAGGHVLMINVGLECCTIIHCGEENIAPQVYLHAKPESYVCRNRMGQEIRMRTSRHVKLERDFPQFEPMLANDGKLRRATLDGARMMSFAAPDLARIVEQQLHASLYGTLSVEARARRAGGVLR